jgi:CRISPR-associated protein Cas2
MLYVVCYDISDDKTRNQMSERLLDFGVRIQESVFECVLDEEAQERMVETLDKIRLADTDRVRIYRMCQYCADTVNIYGPGEVTCNRSSIWFDQGVLDKRRINDL